MEYPVDFLGPWREKLQDMHVAVKALL